MRLAGLGHRAVVLGDVKRRRDAGIARSPARTPRPWSRGKIGERGVQERRVLALEQPDPAEVGRAGDGAAGDLLGDDRRRLALVAGIERREDRGDRDRADAPVADLAAPPSRSAARSSGMKARPSYSWPPSTIATSPSTSVGEIRRPVAERRQAGARRQADADRADPAQGAPLHDGVDEMRRADHDGVDGLAADARRLP